MPVYRQNILLEVARGIKAFLNFEAGLTRGPTPGEGGGIQSLEEAHKRLEDRNRQIAELEKKVRESRSDAPAGDLKPENVVWMFGTARVGSTWLGSMMDEPTGHTMWHEPLVGALFGGFYYGRGAHRGGKHGILGGPDEKRSRAIRAFILASAHEKFPEVSGDGYLVVKEPNGSNGAPLLAQALPESRMIFLVRDPRDVVSSNLSGKSEGGWTAEAYKRGRRQGTPPPSDPKAIVRKGAKKYLEFIGRSKEAYDAHEGPKVLVRYEELRADTLGTMKRIYSELGIPMDEDEVARAIKKHSWENIPEEKKGEGKFYRKATPGGWREDLTPDQIQMVEDITGPLLQEFYPEQQISRAGV
ncbi:MAG: sulfotransferase [Rubrobacter sp.]|nr:sulfotransferase [Rubrobacter sp.]